MNTTQTINFDIPALQQQFLSKFSESEQAPAGFYAPGRVNLIGDHTDYTGGYVFPCGIDYGSLLIIRKNTNSRYRFVSTNFDLQADLTPQEIDKTYGDNWINYPLGVIDQFQKKGFDIDGVDCLYSGNVPNGAGLSSSASIEVVTAFALNTLFDCQLPMLELIKMAQAAENEFVGMQCGIMDQFAVALAEENRGIMLNCSDLSYRQVPINLTEHIMVVANTNQRRELNESAYNERVAECTRALSIMQKSVDITQLGQLSIEQLQQNKDAFANDPIAYNRAMHITGENNRVLAAVPALERGDLAAFGQLMNESHDSLRDLFEVSSDPLDALVGLARLQPGTLGSRLTGAGFGGCTINLVEQATVDAFISTVSAQYKKLTGLSADFYIIKLGSGVHKVTL